MADTFGEIFIDWQVKDTVSVSFADSTQLKPLTVLRWLKADHLVNEIVEKYYLLAQFENPCD